MPIIAERSVQYLLRYSLGYDDLCQVFGPVFTKISISSIVIHRKFYLLFTVKIPWTCAVDNYVMMNARREVSKQLSLSLIHI